MKQGLGCIVAMLSVTYLPFSIYGSWLLYNHIHATDLMWFLWWTTIPLSVVISVTSAIITHVLKDKKEIV